MNIFKYTFVHYMINDLNNNICRNFSFQEYPLIHAIEKDYLPGCPLSDGGGLNQAYRTKN